MEFRLTPPQQEVIDSGILLSGFNCVLQMPTGSGKTWLAEHTISKITQKGQRVIYLTPLRAIAEELFLRWKEKFSSPVGIFTGDYISNSSKPPTPFSKASVLIMTPERLDSCTRSWRSHWSWITETDLIVVDEIHLLSDPNRGPRLEGTLLRLMRLNPFLRILGLSATIGNLTELTDWLKGVEYASKWRTIPLTWKTIKFKKAQEKPDLLLEVVQKCIHDGGKSLTFVQSRRRAEQLSKYLTDHGINAVHHHAGLLNTQRKLAESNFRDGNIDAIVATGTLEMGINMPVRQVVLYDLQRFNGDEFVPLSVSSVWQRGGRAGRPGLDTGGEVVLMVPTWQRTNEAYLQGNFEPIVSGLSSISKLSEQIIADVASGLCRSTVQLDRAYSVSLAATQNRMASLSKVVDNMLSSGMLVLKEDTESKNPSAKLQATRLGRIAARQQLAPETILYIKQKVGRHPNLTFFDLLLTVISTDDCEIRIPVDFEELDSISALTSQQPSCLLQGTNNEIKKRFMVHGKRLLTVIKTALIMRTWTKRGDENDVADEFNCYPFEVNKLKDSLIRLLTATIAILDDPSKRPLTGETEDKVLPISESPTLLSRTRALLQMVTHGVDEETASLTVISGLGGILAKRLRQSGINDIEDLALSDPEEVSQTKGISHKRAQTFLQYAVENIQTLSAYYFKDEGPSLIRNPSGWPITVDPYRLRRALDLKVRKQTKDIYLVSGGLEPHQVNIAYLKSVRCDCMDFQKGNTCKHILAIRLFRKENEIIKLVQKLNTSTNKTDSLDLFDLWFSR
ncbi:DEAD/DEAH box helicase [Thermodesulfobacteriota bacterium]